MTQSASPAQLVQKLVAALQILPLQSAFWWQSPATQFAAAPVPRQMWPVP